MAELCKRMGFNKQGVAIDKRGGTNQDERAQIPFSGKTLSREAASVNRFALVLANFILRSRKNALEVGVIRQEVLQGHQGNLPGQEVEFETAHILPFEESFPPLP